MIAREYNKRIAVNVYTDAEDGFGGRVSSGSEAITIWAKLVNPSSSRATDLGLSDIYNSLVFKVRYMAELMNGRVVSLNYNNQEYTIQGVVDVDQFHRELEITCTTQLNPIPIG